MDWQGDAARFQHLCELLALASTPDTGVQQQVMHSLNQLNGLPDFVLYLAFVFARRDDQGELVRQSAGLLLKRDLERRNASPASLPPQVAEYISAHALIAVRGPSKVIRHTAGIVITTLVQKLGVAACRPTLDQLVQCLGDEANPDVVEGSFNALNKLCEDNVTLLQYLREAAPEHAQPFVSWSAECLLPRVCEKATSSSHVHARANAIECLNHFALNRVLNDGAFAELQPFAARYVEVLGILANDSDTLVLRDVCKGFVCVIEQHWSSCLDLPGCQVVLQFMLKASKHEEYAVRLEALEVWRVCTYFTPLVDLLRPMLPELVPVLLANMVYSSSDYMGMEQAQMDDDNAAVPDQLEDIQPRFHREQGDEPDEESSSHGAWGAEWTARKAAASSLDNMANALRQEILGVVLPLIQQKLEDQNWEVQESGVLALGAIAFGCMDNLVQFLPGVMQLLLRLCEAPKPLLRSISCWCASRFSQWICHRQNPNREEILRSVLQALLKRVLDKNKRVQEAACSAFATLEDAAQYQLKPYLDDIVRTLVRAFQYYQAKNLLILYDATGTLAASVGSGLARTPYVEALLVPLMQKFESVNDNDRSIIPLFECLAQLAHNLGPAFLPVVPRVVERCVRLLAVGARASQMWQQNPNEFEKPDRDMMAASIDLLSAIIEGLREGVGQVLAQHNFICVVPGVLQDPALNVRQSAFAMVGDAAKNCIEYLQPFLPDVLPLCAKSLRENSSTTVSNNAAWAIGEVCVKVGSDAIAPYLEGLIEALTLVLQRQHNSAAPQQLLMQNVCITIGRLGLVAGHRMGKQIDEFLQVWCVVMRGTALDQEKISAFRGFCNMVRANPQAGLSCMPELAMAICSCWPAPQDLQSSFQEILNSYKQTLGANWKDIYGRFPGDLKQRLHHMYSLAE